MSADFTPRLLLELLSTGASLMYIVLLIREKIACWAFGIAGSLLSIILFIDVRLYSEALLYLFYALMGVWGWIQWQQRTAENGNPVIRWPFAVHLRSVIVACAVALGLGYLMQHFSDAQRPVFDAFTTIFSFLGTYLEITKVLEAWIYWFVINLASMWLYHDRALDIYALLIGFYSVMCIWGFIGWRRTYMAQPAV